MGTEGEGGAYVDQGVEEHMGWTSEFNRSKIAQRSQRNIWDGDGFFFKLSRVNKIFLGRGNRRATVSGNV